jgi:hypothetical protein
MDEYVPAAVVRLDEAKPIDSLPLRLCAHVGHDSAIFTFGNLQGFPQFDERWTGKAISPGHAQFDTGAVEPSTGGDATDFEADRLGPNSCGEPYRAKNAGHCLTKTRSTMRKGLDCCCDAVGRAGCS